MVYIYISINGDNAASKSLFMCSLLGLRGAVLDKLSMPA